MNTTISDVMGLGRRVIQPITPKEKELSIFKSETEWDIVLLELGPKCLARSLEIFSPKGHISLIPNLLRPEEGMPVLLFLRSLLTRRRRSA
jgi:hypothetical protein